MVFFNNNNINLRRYQCAKCGRTPESSHEVFKGCTCGHRLFRIISDNISNSKDEKINSISSHCDFDFLSVRERGVGIYDINVDKLLGENEQKKDLTVVAGNNGVFTIHLQPVKRKK